MELKAVEKVLPIHKARLFSYMKLLDAPVGLLINFHETTLKDGIHRLILPGTQTGGYSSTFAETEGSGEVSEQKKTKATENRDETLGLTSCRRWNRPWRVELKPEKTLRYLC
jgi:hypothetical protein